MGSKQTTQTSIAGMTAQDRTARGMLEQLGQRGMDQMGNLSDLASGNLQLSPQDVALIQQINALSGQQARNEFQQNYETVRGRVEGGLLDRGLANSSIEAVSQALMGQQLQQSLDQGTLQGQITSAQQMRQQALDSAGIKLNANQLLLQQILGGAGQLASMGLNERLAQTKTTSKTGGIGAGLGAAAQLGGMGLGFINSGGASMSGADAARALSSPYLTQDIYGD